MTVQMLNAIEKALGLNMPPPSLTPDSEQSASVEGVDYVLTAAGEQINRPGNLEGYAAPGGEGQLARDVMRLRQLMADYGIVPHLWSNGGMGFRHPLGAEWIARHAAELREFSALWFSLAGEVLTRDIGHTFRVYNPANSRIAKLFPKAAVGESGAGPSGTFI